MPIEISLLATTNQPPLTLTSHAAKTCYQAEPPQWGELIDVEKNLFATGHHTTLQHFFCTFHIEGIAVGDITLGLHLCSPFYNSDQRSGRFCGMMFERPNFAQIKRYIKKFWPQITPGQLTNIITYIKQGVSLYHQNIGPATTVTEKFIRHDRPLATGSYIAQNAPKIAQEQLRMFIPVIFPTGFDFTVNLTALAAMHAAAWTPVMRFATQKMVALLLEQHPELAFMFNQKGKNDWAPALPSAARLKNKTAPGFRLLGISDTRGFIPPQPAHTHPLDLLYFLPNYMNNFWGKITTEVEISLATMGQDQRHRTIGRSQPQFTGNFYLPPVIRALGLHHKALALMRRWLKVSRSLPPTLAMVLAPYGAMVRYKKVGSLNAVAHEQGKRLCWCAQQEIYEAGRRLRQAIGKRGAKNLLPMLEPVCFRTGRCGEGRRYCGRDIRLREKGEVYFPSRRV